MPTNRYVARLRTNSHGRYRDLLVLHQPDDNVTTTLLADDLDDLPGLDTALTVADRILTASNWRRTSGWLLFPTGDLMADVTGTYGMITVTLVVATTRDQLPGVRVGSDQLPELPGLYDHPDAYAFMAASGRLGSSDFAVWLIPAGDTVEGYPTLTITLPATAPLYDTAHFTVDMFFPVVAGRLAARICSLTGVRPSYDGTNVGLTRTALDRLSQLPRGYDGHFDGKHIQWGPITYPVVELTVQDLVAAAAARCPGCGSKTREIRANAPTHGNPCNNTWHTATLTSPER
jgi:hypothetical protein